MFLHCASMLLQFAAVAYPQVLNVAVIYVFKGGCAGLRVAKVAATL